MGALYLRLFYSASNNSCMWVVDRWLDNAGEQRALSLLRMSDGDG